ncbi:serine hydrolase domain-containing protein [Brachybacterium aquaticum]|uniref:CubicO group peptidase (Beta-lactamase class C family) n=1 Tax=Brachybacterium aquaticum TaxID=1432564 RepID=A0A841AHF9_9MICO|nr:serine hydrolase domain-containing protein [Brachybacterium aquaticum]MBB5832765.1 CubicO group peptidase (beta-lactamase class C family) [Brachybacterium aquaticum]
MTADAPVPDPLLLLPLRQRILEQHLGVRALHLHRTGHEELSHRFVEDTAENVYSVSKTVTALAIGIAIDEGLLGLDDLVAGHLAAPAGGYGSGVEQIRIRHLLSMTTTSPVLGFEDSERDSEDLTSLILGTDLRGEPGTAWEYSNGSIFLLSRLLTEVTGQTMRDWLMPRLFLPLGILNPQWHTTRDGHTWGATGLHLKSGQLARIGRLLLDRGAHEGTQLVPASWIDALHAEEIWVATGDPEPESARYGFGVWDCTTPGAWRADGAYGQFLLVLPEQQAVLTVTSHLEGRGGAVILAAIREELLPLL